MERNQRIRTGLKAAGLFAAGLALGNAHEIADGFSNFQHKIQENEARLEREKEAKRIANNQLAKKYGIDEISKYGLTGTHELIGEPTYVILKENDQEKQTLRINWVDNEGAIIVSYLNPKNVKLIIPEDPNISPSTEFQFSDEYLQFLGWNPEDWGLNANDYLDDNRVTTLISLNQAAFDSIQEPSS